MMLLAFRKGRGHPMTMGMRGGVGTAPSIELEEALGTPGITGK